MIATYRSMDTAARESIEAMQKIELNIPFMVHHTFPKTQSYVMDEAMVNGIPRRARRKSAIARFAMNTLVMLRRLIFRYMASTISVLPTREERIMMSMKAACMAMAAGERESSEDIAAAFIQPVVLFN